VTFSSIPVKLLDILDKFNYIINLISYIKTS